MSDLLTNATNRIGQLVSRKVAPLSTLEAVFQVTELMGEDDAKAILQRLMQQRFLCQVDGDLAQMLAARLGVEVKWSHMPLGDLVRGEGQWVEGRGS